MNGKTWISVPLYDDDDIATWHLVKVQWEHTTAMMGIGADWTTEILKFPEGLSEQVKKQLRTEVQTMQEELMDINDQDDYEQFN